MAMSLTKNGLKLGQDLSIGMICSWKQIFVSWREHKDSTTLTTGKGGIVVFGTMIHFNRMSCSFLRHFEHMELKSWSKLQCKSTYILKSFLDKWICENTAELDGFTFTHFKGLVLLKGICQRVCAECIIIQYFKVHSLFSGEEFCS